MDAPQLEPDSPVPLYVQIADFVAAQVAAGKLASGARLPAERQLAEMWGVAYTTIRRASREMRERETVISVAGKGTYIR